MRVIIAGSREGVWPELISTAVLRSNFNVTEVVSGNARGVDQWGEDWAKEHNKALTIFPALWKVHGKSAGFKRNAEMAEYADALIAIWNGTSNGTKHMIETMQKLGKPVYIYNVKDTT